MIISKAIEILNIYVSQSYSKFHPDHTDSVKLGIEALKRIQNGRLHPFAPMYHPLIGESMPERGLQAGLQSRQSKKTKQA